MENTIKHIGLLTSGGDAGTVAEGHQNGGIAELASITARRLPDVDIRVFILGHIQRDGSPSCADRVLAERLGVDAIEQLHSGESDTMVAFQHQTMCCMKSSNNSRCYRLNSSDSPIIWPCNITG